MFNILMQKKINLIKEELFRDLKRLENEVGLKWLTTEEQRLKWEKKPEFTLEEQSDAE